MISVVIPTLDEERALPATLEALASESARYEVIVVDGGSTDRTLEIARGATGPGWQVLEAKRGRARQLNAGAAAASGEWLLFLHADTLLPGNGLELIASLPPTVQAGCFHHRFSGGGAMLAALTWFHNRRFAFTRVIYGDQAMFVRRRLFTELGGFPDRPMEDIAFGLRLRDATRPIMLPAAVITDSRKFDQMGRWRALYRAVSLLVRFRLGRDVAGDPFFTDFR